MQETPPLCALHDNVQYVIICCKISENKSMEFHTQT